MKNKKWLLILIIIIPSTMWVILESSTINSNKLPFYGPKKAITKGDTTFYKVTDEFLKKDLNDSVISQLKISTTEFPIYAIMFIKASYIDTGRTLNRLMGLLEARNPRSLEICALLHKHIADELKHETKFVGYDAPHEFLVGYGLDHAESFRHLPYIASLL